VFAKLQYLEPIQEPFSQILVTVSKKKGFFRFPFRWQPPDAYEGRFVMVPTKFQVLGAGGSAP